MFSAGAIVATLGLDASPFRQGMIEATAIAQVFPATVTNFLASPILGVIGLTRDLGSALSSALGSGVRLAADYEQATVAFTTMLGSAAAAKQTLADLSNFAATTPFEMPGITEAARKLLAFNTPAAELIPTLRAIGDVSAGIGAPLSDIAEIYGKARVQGRLFGEDINQLLGRGIPIVGELAKQFGVAESEVRKLVENGQVNFGNLQQAFVSLTAEGGRFSGLMAAQSLTVSGLFSTLRDNVNLALRDVSATLIEAFDLRGLMSSAINAVGAFGPVAVGVASQVGATLGPALASLRSTLGGLGPAWDALREHAATTANVLVGLGGYVAGPAVAGALRALGGVVLGLVNPFRLAATAVQIFTLSFGPLKLVDVLARLAAAGLGILAVQFATSEQGMARLRAAAGAVVAGFNALAGVVESAVVPAFRGGLSAALAAFGPYLPAVHAGVGLLRAGLASLAGFITGTVVPAVGGALVAVLALVKPALLAAGGLVGDLAGRLAAFATFLGSTVAPAVGAAVATAFASASQYFPLINAAIAVAIGYVTGTVVPAVAAAAGAMVSHAGEVTAAVVAIGVTVAAFQVPAALAALPAIFAALGTAATAVAAVLSARWWSWRPLRRGWPCWRATWGWWSRRGTG